MDKIHINTAYPEKRESIDFNNLPKYKSYTKSNFRKIPQIQENFTEEEMFEMEVVARVLPFKSNNYVINELIDWRSPREDPMFILTFPQKDMLKPEHFDKMASVMKSDSPKHERDRIAVEIRRELNPHPAGQVDSNMPRINGRVVDGMQHKYDQTALFFPKQGQTCHSYCTFCFRWPQFVNADDVKFASKEMETIIEYFKAHPEITDILFTGGDPMVMSPSHFSNYIDALIEADIPNLQNVRIGSKSLSYWPYTYLEEGGEKILDTFRKANKAGLHISFMAHFNHHRELTTPALREAVRRINGTGARIRTQSPVFRRINDNADMWAKMWKEQVKLGMIPYYMFIARDTGAQHYFALSLEKCQEIFRKAYQQVSGLARTVRGPSMSCGPGKIHVLGISEIAGEKVFVLRFLQGRNSDWIGRPFFAKYDNKAIWIDDLKPAFGEDRWFWQDEYSTLLETSVPSYSEQESIVA